MEGETKVFNQVSNSRPLALKSGAITSVGSGGGAEQAVLLICITVVQRPTVGVGGGSLDIFLLLIMCLFFFPNFGKGLDIN